MDNTEISDKNGDQIMEVAPIAETSAVAVVATASQGNNDPVVIGTPNQGYLKRDSQIKREEDSGKIEFIVVKNDK